jgi:hypothetical protein
MTVRYIFDANHHVACAQNDTPMRGYEPEVGLPLLGVGGRGTVGGEAQRVRARPSVALWPP